MSSELEEARARMAALDEELVTLAAERVGLARRVGAIKRAAGRPTIDYEQERRVLERAARAARARGLEPAVAEDLVARLVEAAVTAQEEESLRHAATGDGRTAVVVGGAGRMGRWMVRFLAAQGWTALALDPAAPAEEAAAAGRALAGADLVVCSTPPSETARLYGEWAATVPPRGVVVDLASIKSPLAGPIAALRRAGARVASIHPMFGPETPLLRDKEVVVCDTGDAEAMAAVEALFRPTTAVLVRLPLADHDRVMADVLSLAHAAVLAFTFAMPERRPVARSNTYRALAVLAANATAQNPDVYFQIQALNPHALEAIDRLAAGVAHVREVVASHRGDSFAALLAEGARRVAERAP